MLSELTIQEIFICYLASYRILEKENVDHGKSFIELVVYEAGKVWSFIYFVFVTFSAHVCMRNCATNTIFILLCNEE